MIPEFKRSRITVTSCSKVSSIRSNRSRFQVLSAEKLTREQKISSSKETAQSEMRQFVICGTLKKLDPRKASEFLNDDVFEASRSEGSEFTVKTPYSISKPIEGNRSLSLTSEATENSRLKELLSAATHARSKSQETIEIFENLLVDDKKRTIADIGRNLDEKLTFLKKNVASFALQNLQLIDQLLEAEKSMRQVRLIYEKIHDAYSRPLTFSCNDDFTLDSLPSCEYFGGRSKCESCYDPPVPDFEDLDLKRHVASRKQSIRKRFVSASLREYIIQESLSNDEGLRQLASDDCCESTTDPTSRINDDYEKLIRNEVSSKAEFRSCDKDTNNYRLFTRSLSRDDDGYVSETNVDERRQLKTTGSCDGGLDRNEIECLSTKGKASPRGEICFVATCSSGMMLRTEGNRIAGLLSDAEDDKEEAKQSSKVDQASVVAFPATDATHEQVAKSKILCKSFSQRTVWSSSNSQKGTIERAATEWMPNTPGKTSSCDPTGENAKKTTDQTAIERSSQPNIFAFGSRVANVDDVSLSMKKGYRLCSGLSYESSMDLDDEREEKPNSEVSAVAGPGRQGAEWQRSQLQKKMSHFLLASAGEGRKTDPMRR